MYQAVLSFAFHQRQYHALAFTTYDQIAFPISVMVLRVYTRGVFVDAHAAQNDSTAIFATESTTSLLSGLVASEDKESHRDRRRYKRSDKCVPDRPHLFALCDEPPD
jgi:hypothetical protein